MSLVPVILTVAMHSPIGSPLDKLRAFLSRLRPDDIVAAYLFGSHAEDRAHRESDVDIGVLFDFQKVASRKARFERALLLSSSLAAALDADRVDLVVLNDAPPGLAASIVADGQQLYLSDAEAEHAFRRDSQLRAADLLPFITRSAKLKLESLDK